MSQIEEAIRDHERRCGSTIEKRLVPWTWMITIIISLILSIGGVSWFLSAGYADVSSKTTGVIVKCDKFEKRLDKLETMQKDITWIRNALTKTP